MSVFYLVMAALTVVFGLNLLAKLMGWVPLSLHRMDRLRDATLLVAFTFRVTLYWLGAVS